MEMPKQPGEHDENTFILDQYGVIVDATTGRASPYAPVVCPKKKLTDEEIAKRVNEERKLYGDLPPAPTGKFTTRVSARRCMYVYYETQEPEGGGTGPTVSFTVDQYGSVYSFYNQ